MRIQQSVLNAVMFACRNRLENKVVIRKPVGTAFAVAVQGAPNTALVYAVTSRHVIEGDGERASPLILRANGRDGRFFEYETQGEDWFVSDAADVAVHVFTPDERWLESYVPPQDFIGPGPHYGFRVTHTAPDGTQTHLNTQVLTGDDVAIIGLFSQDYGQENNLPIARFGHIARMPSLVSTPRWRGDSFRSVAYLVECQSWGGLSGSPVVWFQSVQKIDEKKNGVRKYEQDFIPALMGCICGHFEIKKQAETIGDPNWGQIFTELNSGIAVVTPSWAIMELLFREDVVEQRNKIVETAGPPVIVSSDTTEPVQGELSRVNEEQSQCASQV